MLLQIVKKNDQLSEQILHRNEEEDLKRALESIARDTRDREMAEKIQEQMEREREIEELERLKQIELDRQAGDEWHSDQLKKMERQKKDRRSELERLRAAASEIERSKKVEEEEIAQLRRKIAAEERTKPMQVQSSKKNSRVQDEVDEEKEWEGDFMVEEATSEEEEEEIIVQPVRRSSTNVRRNPSKSPKRPPIVDVSTDDDDDDVQSVRSSKVKTARRKLSSASFREEDLPSRKSSKLKPVHRNLSRTSLRVETDEDTEEEEDYVSRPRVNRKPQSSPGRRPVDVDGLMAHLTPLGLGGSPHWNGSGMHNPYFPTYGGSISPPMGPYGYGMGLPGTVINSGVGNITNTTISNVGNNNSVRKVYRK